MTSYVKIPVFHFFEKVNKGQLKMVNFSYQNFPNSGMGVGSEILLGEGGFFFEENLRRSDFDDSNLFQS